MDAMDFLPMLREKLKLLDMDEKLMNRSVNEGFSGGEKKRNEILQMAVLEPKLAILDETDSGLDIDALRIVAQGVNAMRNPERAILVVTHYQRLLNYIVPDFVHVLVDGRIVRSGGPELALELEEKGYGSMEAEARHCYTRLMRTREEQSDRGNSAVWKIIWRASANSRTSLPAMPCHGCESCARMRSRVSAKSGFPTTHDEDWRFTNVSAIAQTPFQLARNGSAELSSRGDWSHSGCRALPVSWSSWTDALRPNFRCLGKLPDGREGQQSRWGDFAAIPGRSQRTSAAISTSSAMPSAH